jgi:RHS repeat-associated protein
LEEHQYQYSGSGSSATNTSNTYYYSLNGLQIGMLSGGSTQATSFLLTDTLGSVAATISNVASSATVLGNQLYSSYGSQTYAKGNTGTAKGFTGQYQDSVTNLDYYVARYYDPVVGRFVSADTTQGNPQAMDPYAYVGGNPETRNDPTGHKAIASSEGGDSSMTAEEWAYRFLTSRGLARNGLPYLLNAILYNRRLFMLAESYAQYQLHMSLMYLAGVQALAIRSTPGINWNANTQMQELSIRLGALEHNAVAAMTGESGIGSGGKAPIAIEAEMRQIAEESAGALKANPGCSFISETSVATEHGKESIGTLHVGEKVWAYNSKTHQMELQPILLTK